MMIPGGILTCGAASAPVHIPAPAFYETIRDGVHKETFDMAHVTLGELRRRLAASRAYTLGNSKNKRPASEAATRRCAG